MAAETQPRFICGQPTHSAAWEGMKSGQRPPHSTPAQEALRGVGCGSPTRVGVNTLGVGGTARTTWFGVQSPLHLFPAV